MRVTLTLYPGAEEAPMIHILKTLPNSAVWDIPGLHVADDDIIEPTLVHVTPSVLMAPTVVRSQDCPGNRPYHMR